MHKQAETRDLFVTANLLWKLTQSLGLQFYLFREPQMTKRVLLWPSSTTRHVMVKAMHLSSSSYKIIHLHMTVMGQFSVFTWDWVKISTNSGVGGDLDQPTNKMFWKSLINQPTKCFRKIDNILGWSSETSLCTLHGDLVEILTQWWKPWPNLRQTLEASPSLSCASE